MKKILLGFVTLILLPACGGDNDEAMEAPLRGQYVAEQGNITASIYFDNGAYITIYTDGICNYQDVRTGGYSSGNWPDYTYTFTDPRSLTKLVLRCSFTDAKNFTSTSNSDILPSPLYFRYDNRVLDENGDGILDD